MTLDLDAIEQAARAANQSPWRVYQCGDGDEHEACGIKAEPFVSATEDAYQRGVVYDTNRDECHHMMMRVNAEHIATANPSTVLALVALVRELEAAILALSDQSGWSAAHYNGCGQSKIGIAGCAACRMDDVADALRAKVRP